LKSAMVTCSLRWRGIVPAPVDLSQNVACVLDGALVAKCVLDALGTCESADIAVVVSGRVDSARQEIRTSCAAALVTGRVDHTTCAARRSSQWINQTGRRLPGPACATYPYRGGISWPAAAGWKTGNVNLLKLLSRPSIGSGVLPASRIRVQIPLRDGLAE